MRTAKTAGVPIAAWQAAVVTKEALSQAIHRVPFQPFSLRLADGRAVRVPHQDFISMHPTGRTVIVYGRDEDLEILDVMLVTGLQLPGKASKRRP